MSKRKTSVADEYVKHHFITNQYGIWCPNCQEAIDMFWPESCDHCGYPHADYDRFDENEDDYPGGPNDILPDFKESSL